MQEQKYKTLFFIFKIFWNIYGLGKLEWIYWIIKCKMETKKLWKSMLKEMSFCHKLKFSNPYSYIYETWWCKALIFQTLIIWSYRIHSLKYKRSMTLGCKDTRIRKSWFVARIQFFFLLNNITFFSLFSFFIISLFSISESLKLNY